MHLGQGSCGVISSATLQHGPSLQPLIHLERLTALHPRPHRASGVSCLHRYFSIFVSHTAGGWGRSFSDVCSGTSVFSSPTVGGAVGGRGECHSPFYLHVVLNFCIHWHVVFTVFTCMWYLAYSPACRFYIHLQMVFIPQACSYSSACGIFCIRILVVFTVVMCM